MRFWATYIAESDHRLRRLGSLTTNVNVGMVEVGTFAFQAVEGKNV